LSRSLSWLACGALFIASSVALPPNVFGGPTAGADAGPWRDKPGSIREKAIGISIGRPHTTQLDRSRQSDPYVCKSEELSNTPAAGWLMAAGHSGGTESPLREETAIAYELGARARTGAMTKILIVDDEPDFSSGIAEYLELKGHSVVSTNTLSAGRDALRQIKPDALVLDLMLPDGSGLELLDAFSDHRPDKVVIITGHAGVKNLIGGMAGDGVAYMTKPIEPRELLTLLGQVDEARSKEPEGEGHFGLMVGESPAIRAVYDTIRQVARTDSTVFVQGESGTGKELVAEAIHTLSGVSGPFVPVNCGSLSKDLLSSQLFGHEKGSFTGATRRHAGFFERADNGTLFLDEITEMPAEMQTHLLRALETGRILRVGAEKEFPVNTRLIAATNRDPAKAVKSGKLREDLYFRLRVFPITLPPLRERTGDIGLLARHFLDALNAKHRTNKHLTDTGLQRLEQHSWPGNVRELKHTVHRAYIMSDDDAVNVPGRFDEDLPSDIEGLRVGRSIADVEKDLILATLEHLDGDKKAAATSLGISLKTLYNRLKEYGEPGTV
jgi:DNA-binding NtrC family response regulator